MQRVSDRVSYTVFLAIGAACILTFLLVRLPRATQTGVLGLDGKGYFFYLRSLVFDGDLDFRNEGAYFGGIRALVPATGLPGNPYSVGPALLWAPAYLLAHLCVLTARGAGVGLDATGYGLAYQSAVCIATMLYTTAGSLLTYRVCRRYFSPLASSAAVVGTWLASSLIHYTVGAPDMSHGVSYFAVSLFLFLWHPPRSRTYREWALLGLSVGLMTLVRWQNMLYLGTLAIEGIQVLAAGQTAAKRLAVLREYVKGGLIAAVVAAVVFSPQMLAWNTLYGVPLTVPPDGGPEAEGFFDLLHPNLLEYLFSTRNGLYTWHPIMLLATLGLVALWQRDKKVATALIGALLAQWWLNASLIEWWGGWCFGARRFISATPMLALGMAALAQSLTGRFRRGALVLAVTVSVLVCWNLLFDLQFSWGFIPHGEALTLRQLTVGKLEMILQLLNRVVP